MQNPTQHAAMQFFAVRCLACQNLDSEPRFGYDQIPFCSQVCAEPDRLGPKQLTWDPVLVFVKSGARNRTASAGAAAAA